MSSETSTIGAPRGRGRFERPFGECAVWRYYDPQTGQFLMLDPETDTTGTPYFYAGGDPVNQADPSGLCATAMRARTTLNSTRVAPRPPFNNGEDGLRLEVDGVEVGREESIVSVTYYLAQTDARAILSWAVFYQEHVVGRGKRLLPPWNPMSGFGEQSPLRVANLGLGEYSILVNLTQGTEERFGDADWVVWESEKRNRSNKLPTLTRPGSLRPLF